MTLQVHSKDDSYQLRHPTVRSGGGNGGWYNYLLIINKIDKIILMKVGIRPNCDLNLLTDNVKRNIDVMFIKH